LQNQEHLVTILIPAYNSPKYTQKTLESIVQQTHRPIEIILMDDNSPQSLEPMYLSFLSNLRDDEITARYYRNDKNLGWYFNLQAGLRKVSGDYLVLMPHDDWFLDEDFLRISLDNMQSLKNCFVFIGNSEVEELGVTMFTRTNSKELELFAGRTFLSRYFFKNIHPSHSAIVLNFNELKKIDFNQLFYSESECAAYGIIPDEGFVLSSALMEQGFVWVLNRIVSVRGNPENSLSKSSAWGAEVNLIIMLAHLRLYSYFVRKNSILFAIITFRMLMRLPRINLSDIRKFIRAKGLHPFVVFLTLNCIYSEIRFSPRSKSRSSLRALLLRILPAGIFKILVNKKRRLIKKAQSRRTFRGRS
jgi:glycosyltransferase involved in cell wall biosynthesis